MPKVTIVDDIFTPDEKIVINFTGQNPFRVCQIIRPLFEKIVQVEGKDTFERIFKWDITEDPRGFYDSWHVQKEEDKWTMIRIKSIIQGKQHTKTKSGKVRIELYAWIETVFEYTNPFQKAFWFFYNKVFYYKRKRQYVERGKEYVFAIRDELYRELKIPRE